MRKPAYAGRSVGDPDGRGVGTVGRPERVVDVDVRVGRELGRERRVVLLLLRVEAEVLEEDDLAGPEPLDGVLRPDAERVAGHGHVLADQLRRVAPRQAGVGARRGPCRWAARDGSPG